ncbi:MAG: NfeD family protein [Acidimicrobiia bacterium]
MLPFLLAVTLSLQTVQPAGPIEVLEVTGPIDATLVEFLEGTLQEAVARGSQAVILQLDAPGAVTEDIHRLLELVEDPPLPVVVWVGPAPAVAYGGAAQLLAAAQVGLAAPGTRIGYLQPTVAGGGGPSQAPAGMPPRLLDEAVLVEGPVPGLVAEAIPTLGQVVVGLHGRMVTVRGEARTLATAEPSEGGEGPRPAVGVRFHQPGLVARVLRMALRPEAAFLFLVAGLAVGVFEYYALGPGIAAAVAVLLLLVGGYGLAVLPLTWWALSLTLGGLGLLAADVQRGAPGIATATGLVMLAVGGLRFTDAAPQLVPTWWAVLATVVAVGLFFRVGITTVARARFSTPTIGREHLIGRQGKAASDLTPEGVVLVGEAQWKAVSHRQAGIRAGDPVTVVGVRGAVLRVEPAER